MEKSADQKHSLLGHRIGLQPVPRHWVERGLTGSQLLVHVQFQGVVRIGLLRIAGGRIQFQEVPPKRVAWAQVDGVAAIARSVR